MGELPAKISPSRVSVGLVRFWVLTGAAALALLLGIGKVVDAIEWRRGDSKPCPGDPKCVEMAPAFSRGAWAVAYIACFFALGAVFVYLAIRAKRRRVTSAESGG